MTFAAISDPSSPPKWNEAQASISACDAPNRRDLSCAKASNRNGSADLRTAQPTCSLSPAEQPARMHDVAFMRTPSIAIRTAVVYVRYVAAQFYRLDRQLRADLSPHCIEGA